MATSRSSRCVGVGSVCRTIAMVTVVASLLMTSCSCLPSGAPVKKPSHPDDVLLLGAVSEMEDALTRLKQYAKSLKSEMESTEQGAGDPLAEAVERDLRDEDYRQEPEIVPDLDRFEKNLEESKESVRTNAEVGPKSIAAPGASSDPSQRSDDVSDVSLQDFVNFLRENIKGSKKEGGTGRSSNLNQEEKSNAKPQLPAPSSVSSSSPSSSTARKDVSIKELLEFLKEYQKHNKDHSGLPTQAAAAAVRPSTRKGDTDETQNKTDTDNQTDTGDMSLKDALEYLASLKKKLNSEKTQ